MHLKTKPKQNGGLEGAKHTVFPRYACSQVHRIKDWNGGHQGLKEGGNRKLLINKYNILVKPDKLLLEIC